MKPTIEEVRRAIERYMGTGEYGAAAIAAIDVAQAASRCVADETGADGLIESVDAFRATIAPSTDADGGTS